MFKSAAIIQDANTKYSSQYKVELANHLPMALVALERMGAPLERLQEYTANYVKRLSPIPPRLDMRITKDNWESHLGLQKHHVSYIEYFSNSIKTFGAEKVLRDCLPRLFVGVAGGAFHGLIRLGYALDSQNTEEIAQSLAYWALSYLPLESGTTPQGDRFSLEEVFTQLNHDFQGFRPKAPNISRRMEIISSLDTFQRTVRRADPQQMCYETLAPIALALFLQTQDFTALHGVTAAHAFRLVRPFLPDERSSAYFLYIAITAAYVSIQSPKLLPETSPETNDTSNDILWEEIKSQALDSNDDHIPKIAYSCYEEFRFHGNAAYLEAARRYLLNPDL